MGSIGDTVTRSNYLDPEHVEQHVSWSATREAPGQPFISSEDGTSWTRTQAVVEAIRAGDELHRAGLRQDSRRHCRRRSRNTFSGIAEQRLGRGQVRPPARRHTY